MQRFLIIDQIRGLAIILMVVYHLIYDLAYFGYFDFDMNVDDHWRYFRMVIMTLFIGVSGICLSLAYRKQFNLQLFGLRAGKLALCALLISLISLVIFPNSWIFFGILHFLLVSSLVCVCFVRLPVISLLLGLVCLVVSWLELLPFWWPFEYISQYLPQERPQDYVPLLPWLGIAFISMSMVSYIPHSWFEIKIPGVLLVQLGQRSLMIYMIHQPIIFGVIWLYGRVS